MYANPDERGKTQNGGGRRRYTFILLNEVGTWIDLEIFYAADDHEAFEIAIDLAEGRPFEVWQGFRLVSSPFETRH